MCVYIYIYIHTYVYIHMLSGRKRWLWPNRRHRHGTECNKHTNPTVKPIYIYIYIWVLYIYIYTHLYTYTWLMGLHPPKETHKALAREINKRSGPGLINIYWIIRIIGIPLVRKLNLSCDVIVVNHLSYQVIVFRMRAYKQTITRLDNCPKSSHHTIAVSLPFRLRKLLPKGLEVLVMVIIVW